MQQASHALYPELPAVFAPRDPPPRRHQIESVADGWQAQGWAYFLEMGLGKSRVLTDDFCLNFATGQLEGLLVLATKSVYTNWSRRDDDNPGELQSWMWEGIWEKAEIYTYTSGRGSRDGHERASLMDTLRPTARVLVVNVESLVSTQDAEALCARFLRSHRCMIAVDESTILKNPTSKRTKAMLRLSRLASKRRIMTGTPSSGSNSDLWSQFEFLSPGRNLLGHPRFSTFRARYCAMKEIYVGGRSVKVETGPMNTAELARIVGRHSTRRRKRDCLDLPEKEFRKREVTLTAEQQAAYNEMKRTAMTTIRGSDATTSIVMTQLMRLHQIVCGHITTDDGRVMRLASERMLATEELIDATEEQVVIWSAYAPDALHIIQRLREKYGPDTVAEWHGGIPQAQREAMEGEFQDGRRRFMVATQSAGGMGRTWTAGTCVIYYSNNYDLLMRLQSEDRTHRIGTVGTVTYYDLVARGTMDERLIDTLRSKKVVSHAVMAEGPEAWI